MSVSRQEGYVLGRGKEESGLVLAERFLRDVCGMSTRRILDKESNYEYGDLVTHLATYVEVKSQPIDPGRFSRNFLEICELTDNPLHRDGIYKLAATIGCSVEEAKLCRPLRRDGSTVELRDWNNISVSVHTLLMASSVLYCNAALGYVYVYGSDEALLHARDSVVGNKCVLGAGRSNDRTVGAFIPLPEDVWRLGEGWHSANGSGETCRVIVSKIRRRSR